MFIWGSYGRFNVLLNTLSINKVFIISSIISDFLLSILYGVTWKSDSGTDEYCWIGKRIKWTGWKTQLLLHYTILQTNVHHTQTTSFNELFKFYFVAQHHPRTRPTHSCKLNFLSFSHPLQYWLCPKPGFPCFSLCTGRSNCEYMKSRHIS